MTVQKKKRKKKKKVTDDVTDVFTQGCEFKCSLLESGSLQTPGTAGTCCYRTPNQWLNSCWSQLGQHKHSVKSKFAFKNVCVCVTLCRHY